MIASEDHMPHEVKNTDDKEEGNDHTEDVVKVALGISGRSATVIENGIANNSGDGGG